MTYSSAALSAQRRAAVRRNQNSVSMSGRAVLGPISHTILLAVMLCVLGLIYLTQVTKTNALGYQLNDLKQRREELVKENQSLEVESAQLQALERVQNSVPANSLTQATDVSYVTN